MKISCIDKNNYIVYIPNYYYKYEEDTINEYINKVLLRLKKLYNIEIYSVFNINCFIDNDYGIILEIEKIYDLYCVYSKKSDINLNIHDSVILYEVDDYYDNCIIKNNKIYINPKYVNIELANNIVYKNN